MMPDFAVRTQSASEACQGSMRSLRGDQPRKITRPLAQPSTRASECARDEVGELRLLGCCFETIRGNSASNRGRVSKSQMHPLQIILEPVSETGQNGKIGESCVAARTSQRDLRGAALPVSVQSDRRGEGKRVPFAGP